MFTRTPSVAAFPHGTLNHISQLRVADEKGITVKLDDLYADLPLVEGGPAVPFRGSDRDLVELRRCSAELVEGLGLREEPFVVDLDERTVRAQSIVGFVPLHDTTVEIVPRYLRHDPGWRASLIAMVSDSSQLACRPTIDRHSLDAELADLLAMVLIEAISQAGRSRPSRGWPGLNAFRLRRRGLALERLDAEMIASLANHPVAATLTWAAEQLRQAVRQDWIEAELRVLTNLWPDVSRERPSSQIMRGMHLPSQLDFLSEALDVARLLAAASHERAVVWRSDELFGDFVQTVVEETAREFGAVAYRGRSTVTRFERRSESAAWADTDLVIDLGGQVMAVDVMAHDFDLARIEVDGEGVLRAGRALRCSDVAMVFASARAGAATRWKVRGTEAPDLLHVVTLDPSGLGEQGGFRRVVEEFGLDLAAILGVQPQREIGPAPVAETGKRHRSR